MANELLDLRKERQYLEMLASRMLSDLILQHTVCSICERQHGEDGADLAFVHTESCVVPMCKWPCMAVAATHAFIKCRICGSVTTIPKHRIPGGLALGQHTFVMFVEDCNFHKGDVQWPVKVAAQC